MLPIGPFRDWLKDQVRRHGSVEATEGAVGLGARTIRRFVTPNAEERKATTVSLDIVDRALQHEGGTFLWELYYEEMYAVFDVVAEPEPYVVWLFDVEPYVAPVRYRRGWRTSPPARQVA